MSKLSEIWLDNWNREHGENWRRIVDAVQGNVDNATIRNYSFGKEGPEYFIHFDDEDAHAELTAEFWDHVETATGFTLEKARRPVGLSCSC